MPEFQISNRIPSQYQTKKKYPRAMPPVGDKLPPVHSFKAVNRKSTFAPSPRLCAVSSKPVNPHAGSIDEAEEGTEWPEADIQVNARLNAVLNERDAVLNESAPEPVAQPEMAPALGPFGIPFDKLTAASDSRSKFSNFYEQAIQWQREKARKSSYDKKLTGQGLVVTRRKARRSVRFQAWQAKKGNQLQVPFNKFRHTLRDMTGFPRKTGSNYLTDKAKE